MCRRVRVRRTVVCGRRRPRGTCGVGHMNGQDMERTPFVRDFRPIHRRGIERLARAGWGAGRSVWAADIGGRELAVDSVEVTHEPASAAVAGVMGLDEAVNLCVRRRRFVLDGKPVLLSTSYLPADLVANSPITEPDTGPGGVYARLADLGHAPARFREELRSRMPTQPEADRLELPPGAPVIHLARTAFDPEGRVVELNEMVLDSAAYVLEYDFEA
ncbi:GntR family transcriptional regulator [Streptomyces sp. SID6139]|uniref:GntR family transcriptional regulator n=1 Tax=Streptomyces sp. SID6139 TaxID=2690320 RepID=UPI00387ECD09